MKICQLTNVDFGLYQLLLPLMRAMRDEGHDVVGICSDGPRIQNIRDEGFRVETVEMERSYNLISHIRSYRKLVTLFRRECFDIVHVHSPISSLIGRFAAARARVPKVVYTAHGFYFHEHQPWLVRRLFILLEWIAGRFTDVLFTQAEEDANSARYHLLCRSGDITAIGNGVDSSLFYPLADNDVDRKIIRAELGALDADVVILMVGRLVAEKGYIELFQAMEHVDATVRLWVVGNRLESDHAASIVDAIQRIEARSALKDRITFLGYRGDVNRLMRAADIFTLPSYREGMPRSIIEAMMSARPVVATNIRGCREEVVDDETGILVPVRNVKKLAEALNRLAEDKPLRTRMGTKGHDRAMALYNEKTVIQKQLDHLRLIQEPAQ